MSKLIKTHCSTFTLMNLRRTLRIVKRRLRRLPEILRAMAAVLNDRMMPAQFKTS